MRILVHKHGKDIPQSLFAKYVAWPHLTASFGWLWPASKVEASTSRTGGWPEVGGACCLAPVQRQKKKREASLVPEPKVYTKKELRDVHVGRRWGWWHPHMRVFGASAMLGRAAK